MRFALSPASARRTAALLSAVLIAVAPAAPVRAAGIGPVLGGALPRPLPLFPPDMRSSGRGSKFSANGPSCLSGGRRSDKTAKESLPR